MKRTAAFLAASFVALATFAVASEADAANYSLWIHGRNPGTPTQPGNYADWTYWGFAGSGVNAKSVNWRGDWDGTHSNSIASTNASVRNALDCYCTGSNWCYVATHSTGASQIGYALSIYGGGTRYVKNGAPDSTGVCSTVYANGVAQSQTGWNIKWIDNGGSAEGGTELADDGDWLLSEPLVSDLVTSTMRGKYDHNVNRARTFYMFAGADGTIYSGLLRGQDDDVVPYHSAGGVASIGSWCNPGDWFCDGTLSMGTSATSDGRAKWTGHTVFWRDDNEDYSHGDLRGVVRSDMATYAY